MNTCGFYKENNNWLLEFVVTGIFVIFLIYIGMKL